MPVKVLQQASGVQSEVLVAETYQARRTTDVNSTVVTFATTGLSLALVGLGHYTFEFLVPFRSAATGTGLKLQLACPSFTRMACRFEIPITASTAVVAYASQLPATCTGTGVAVSATDYLATVTGTIVVFVAGTLDLQFASEVNGSQVTVMSGSSLLLTRLA